MDINELKRIRERHNCSVAVARRIACGATYDEAVAADTAASKEYAAKRAAEAQAEEEKWRPLAEANERAHKTIRGPVGGLTGSLSRSP